MSELMANREYSEINKILKNSLDNIGTWCFHYLELVKLKKLLYRNLSETDIINSKKVKEFCNYYYGNNREDNSHLTNENDREDNIEDNSENNGNTEIYNLQSNEIEDKSINNEIEDILNNGSINKELYNYRTNAENHNDENNYTKNKKQLTEFQKQGLQALKLQEQEEKNMNLLKQQRREIMEESMKNPPTSEIKFTVSVNGEDIKDDLSSGDEYEPENNKLNENNKQTNSSDYADINALTKISVNDRNILLMKIYMEAKKNIDRQNLIGDNEQYNKLIRDESNRLLDLYIAENS